MYLHSSKPVTVLVPVQNVFSVPTFPSLEREKPRRQLRPGNCLWGKGRDIAKLAMKIGSSRGAGKPH